MPHPCYLDSLEWPASTRKPAKQIFAVVAPLAIVTTVIAKIVLTAVPAVTLVVAAQLVATSKLSLAVLPSALLLRKARPKQLHATPSAVILKLAAQTSKQFDY